MFVWLSIVSAWLDPSLIPSPLTHPLPLHPTSLTPAGKEVELSYGATAKLMLPLLVWVLAVIVIFVVSFIQLEGMASPLAALNMASHVIYR